MEKYINPQIEITAFDSENILTASGIVELNAPKTTVDSTTAVNYGAADFNTVFAFN